MRKEQERVIAAAVGKQWNILAEWIEQGRPFIPSAQARIVKDIRALHRACAALAKKRK